MDEFSQSLSETLEKIANTHCECTYVLAKL